MFFKRILTSCLFFTVATCLFTHLLDAKRKKAQKNDAHTQLPLRGFSASKLLQGIATTCNQVSNVVTAETKKEKQQAVLGVVGSLFMLAGDIISEETKRGSESDQNNQQAQTRAAESFPTLELVTTRSVNTAHLPLIEELAAIKNKQKQNKRLKKLLTYESTAGQLVNEMCLILETLSLSQEKSLIATVKSILSETLIPRRSS